MCGMKTGLGYFTAKVRRNYIFRPIIGNVSPHQDGSDSGVRIVNFATTKNSLLGLFPHRNIRKYNCTCLYRKTHNLIDHILIDSK
jgi:hypothetical protein